MLAASGGDLVERLVGALENGVALGIRLPATHRGVDIERINLKAVGAAANAFRSENCGTGSHEGVEHEVATPGAIAHSIGDQRDWLDRRVNREVVEATGTKCI